MPIIAASNNPWLTPALEAIQSGNVYVDSDVKGASDLQSALENALPDDGSIAVIVLPAAAREKQDYDTYYLDRLTKVAPQKTVILAIGDDLMADSFAIEDTEALRIANENQSLGLQPGLVATVEEIADATPASPGGGAGGGIDPLMPAVIGGVVLVAAAVTAFGLLARRRRRAASRISDDADPVPSGIRLRVTRLRELQPFYAGLPGNAVAAETAAGIDALASHVEQLFTRLDARAGEDQGAIAEAEYSDKLARLVAALERDYLLDLLTRPDLWDAPDERIGEVREALAGLTAQILDNIKQVNARKGLLFQVSLDSLIGRSELRDWERRFADGASE